MLLETNEKRNAVYAREMARRAVAVLDGAGEDVVGHTHIKRAVAAGGEDVGVIGVLAHALLLHGWARGARLDLLGPGSAFSRPG